MTLRFRVTAVLLILLLLSGGATGAQETAEHPPRARDGAPVVVASKPFGESYLLAKIFAQLLG